MRKISMTSRTVINSISIVVLLLIGWLDYITGYEFGFFIFYFIPVSISAWFNGRVSGLAIACASAFCWYLSDKYTHHPYSKAYFIYWEMFMRLISFLTTALTLSKIKDMLNNEQRLNQELHAALHENRKLRNLLPVYRECDRLADAGEERHQIGDHQDPKK